MLLFLNIITRLENIVTMHKKKNPLELAFITKSQGMQYLNDSLNECAQVLVKLFHAVKKLKIYPQQKCPQHLYKLYKHLYKIALETLSIFFPFFVVFNA